jgi:hypothetical protein
MQNVWSHVDADPNDLRGDARGGAKMRRLKNLPPCQTACDVGRSESMTGPICNYAGQLQMSVCRRIVRRSDILPCPELDIFSGGLRTPGLFISRTLNSKNRFVDKNFLLIVGSYSSESRSRLRYSSVKHSWRLAMCTRHGTGSPGHRFIWVTFSHRITSVPRV